MAYLSDEVWIQKEKKKLKKEIEKFTCESGRRCMIAAASRDGDPVIAAESLV